MKRGWLVVILLLSLGVNLGLVGAVMARRAGTQRWERARTQELKPAEGFGRRLADRLELGPEERKQFVAIQRALVERTGEGRRRVGEIRRGLRRELLSAEPDQTRIESLLGDLEREEAALNRAFVDSVLESREVLGEQRAAAYLRFVERFAPGRSGPGREGRPRRRSEGRRP